MGLAYPSHTSPPFSLYMHVGGNIPRCYYVDNTAQSRFNKRFTPFCLYYVSVV